MEYLMFLLHNGKLDDAKQVTQVNSCYLIRKDMDVSECEIKVIRLIDWLIEIQVKIIYGIMKHFQHWA